MPCKTSKTTWPMNNWENHYANGKAMAEAAQQIILQDLGKIRYVNLKIKEQGKKESGWFFEVLFEVTPEHLIITGDALLENRLVIPVDDIEHIRMRPYYYALCVGFKNFIFYNDAAIKGGTV